MDGSDSIGTSTVSSAEAQKIYSIGSLNTGDSFINAFEGFRERMTEFGYRERHNARYQYHNSRGNEELLRTIAHRLVYDKVDLIVTSSTTATKAATRATQGVPIPVVFLSAGNSQKLFKSFPALVTILPHQFGVFGIDRQAV